MAQQSPNLQFNNGTDSIALSDSGNVMTTKNDAKWQQVVDFLRKNRINNISSLVGHFNTLVDENQRMCIREWLFTFVDGLSKKLREGCGRRMLPEYSLLAGICPRCLEDRRLLREQFLSISQEYCRVKIGKKECVEALIYVLQKGEKSVFYEDFQLLKDLLDACLSNLEPEKIFSPPVTYSALGKLLALMLEIFLLFDEYSQEGTSAYLKHDDLHVFVQRLERLVEKSKSHYGFYFDLQTVLSLIRQLEPKEARKRENLRRFWKGVWGGFFIYHGMKSVAFGGIDPSSIEEGCARISEVWPVENRSEWCYGLMLLNGATLSVLHNSELLNRFEEQLGKVKKEHDASKNPDQRKFLGFGAVRQLEILISRSNAMNIKIYAVDTLVDISIGFGQSDGWCSEIEVRKAVMEALITACVSLSAEKESNSALQRLKDKVLSKLNEMEKSNVNEVKSAADSVLRGKTIEKVLDEKTTEEKVTSGNNLFESMRKKLTKLSRASHGIPPDNQNNTAALCVLGSAATEANLLPISAACGEQSPLEIVNDLLQKGMKCLPQFVKKFNALGNSQQKRLLRSYLNLIVDSVGLNATDSIPCSAIIDSVPIAQIIVNLDEDKKILRKFLGQLISLTYTHCCNVTLNALAFALHELDGRVLDTMTAELLDLASFLSSQLPCSDAMMASQQKCSYSCVSVAVALHMTLVVIGERQPDESKRTEMQNLISQFKNQIATICKAESTSKRPGFQLGAIQHATKFLISDEASSPRADSTVKSLTLFLFCDFNCIPLPHGDLAAAEEYCADKLETLKTTDIEKSVFSWTELLTCMNLIRITDDTKTELFESCCEALLSSLRSTSSSSTHSVIAMTIIEQHVTAAIYACSKTLRAAALDEFISLHKAKYTEQQGLCSVVSKKYLVAAMSAIESREEHRDSLLKHAKELLAFDAECNEVHLCVSFMKMHIALQGPVQEFIRTVSNRESAKDPAALWRALRSKIVWLATIQKLTRANDVTRDNSHSEAKEQEEQCKTSVTEAEIGSTESGVQLGGSMPSELSAASTAVVDQDGAGVTTQQRDQKDTERHHVPSTAAKPDMINLTGCADPITTLDLDVDNGCVLNPAIRAFYVELKSAKFANITFELDGQTVSDCRKELALSCHYLDSRFKRYGNVIHSDASAKVISINLDSINPDIHHILFAVLIGNQNSSDSAELENFMVRVYHKKHDKSETDICSFSSDAFCPATILAQLTRQDGFWFLNKHGLPVPASCFDDSTDSWVDEECLCKCPSLATVLRDIIVEILSGRELAPKDRPLSGRPTSDPYYVISFKEKKYKSKHVAKTLRPCWEIKDFELGAVSMTDCAVLRIRVFDYDFWSFDDFMGEINIPAHELFNLGPGEHRCCRKLETSAKYPNEDVSGFIYFEVTVKEVNQVGCPSVSG